MHQYYCIWSFGLLLLEMTFLSIFCVLLVLKIPICEASKPFNDRNENNQTQCLSNYFWKNGECRACPSGYFGTNCSSSCQYPHYGKSCGETCRCNATDCDNVFGCQRNNSEIKTVTVNTKSEVSPTKEKSEYSSAQTASYESQGKSEYSTPQTELYDYQGNVKNNNLRILVIIVGCILVFLIVVNGLKWISKPIRKTDTFDLTRKDNDQTTEYLEINEISEQESVSNTICTTVTARSCTSLNGVEIRPKLPARNTQ